MSMTIEIVEPAVTFGELPDGAVVKLLSLEQSPIVMKHSERSSLNVQSVNGWSATIYPGEPVEVLWLPPGASLKRKPRMVRVDSLPCGSWYLAMGTLRLSTDDDVPPKDFDVRGCVYPATGTLGLAKATDCLVQPCRVTVRVEPEYEA